MEKPISNYLSGNAAKSNFDLKKAKDDELAIAMQSVTELSYGAKKAFARGKLVIDHDGVESREGFEHITSNIIQYRIWQLEKKISLRP